MQLGKLYANSYTWYYYASNGTPNAANTIWWLMSPIKHTTYYEYSSIIDETGRISSGNDSYPSAKCAICPVISLKSTVDGSVANPYTVS